MKKNILMLAVNGIIAAAYSVLTILPLLIPNSGIYFYGFIQLRLSEALCVIPYFLPESIWGLFLGCIITNMIGSFIGYTTPVDIFIGPIATLIAAYLTTKVKKAWMIPFPIIIVNSLLVGTMSLIVYPPLGKDMLFLSFISYFITIAINEAFVCYVFGKVVYNIFNKNIDKLLKK